MLATLKNIDTKELSEIYDPESRDSFISFYLNTGVWTANLLRKESMQICSERKQGII